MIDLQSWARRQEAPFTLGLVASFVAFALWGLFAPRSVPPLALTDPQARPWGLLTYPWSFHALTSPLGLLLLAFFVMWLVQFGTSVERDLGTGRFAGFWLVFTLLPAIVALAMGVGLSEPWLPTTAIVVAWCARNRGAAVAFWGIPLSTPVLAGIVSAFALLPYLMASPLLGLLLALPLGLAWLFGANRLPLAYSRGAHRRRDEPVVKGGTKYDQAYFENVKRREIEREEQERLRRLFEGK